MAIFNSKLLVHQAGYPKMESTPRKCIFKGNHHGIPFEFTMVYPMFNQTHVPSSAHNDGDQWKVFINPVGTWELGTSMEYNVNPGLINHGLLIKWGAPQVVII